MAITTEPYKRASELRVTAELLPGLARYSLTTELLAELASYSVTAELLAGLASYSVTALYFLPGPPEKFACCTPAMWRAAWWGWSR